MPRPSIWNHPTAARKTETRTITDPQVPGWELTLTLRGQLRPGKDAALALRDKWVERYVTGLVDVNGELVKGPNGEPIQPPKTLAIEERDDARIDRELCYWAAFLNVMFVGEEIDRPDIPEVAGWRLKMDRGWEELIAWVHSLNNPGGAGPLAPTPENGASDSSSSGATTSTAASPSSPSATSATEPPASSEASG